ncbi:uncharacterized protein CTRU02_203752 [Colletotrichum truncatum]|uniref:Uncharacterized protein n=1 Tax=Colletotrichum truncatum TaxID=5467 RepID=A0ACC3ZA79_COLTU|nr:uncharacterized protein CTRU02_04084 [Colletotrichum truncatum]KAF6796123.1 hypothetical protein CTRU02_04084 [Colletotrichum truncatum]
MPSSCDNMSTYRRSENYRDRDRRLDRESHSHYDRRGRDRERSRSRERRLPDRDGDRAMSDHYDKPPSGPRDTRPSQKRYSSPLHINSAGSDSRLDNRPNSSPRGQPSNSTNSKPTYETVHVGKITEALRVVSKRSYDHVAIQLRKEVVETRKKERENNNKMSQHKYLEFPSLKEAHRRSEKKDQDDLAALRKEEETADKKSLKSTEDLAFTLLQVFAELQQNKDSRVTTSGVSDGLEAQLVSRLDQLEKQRKEDAERQEKRIDELHNGLRTEIAQRKALGMENESLRARLLELETKSQSLHSVVDDHGSSLKRLHDEKPKAVPEAMPKETTLGATVQAQYVEEIKAFKEECVSAIADLRGEVEKHDAKLGEMDVELIGESCDAIVTKLPRFEQNVKKVIADVLAIRTDTAQLQSDLRQLESRTKVPRADEECCAKRADQLKSDTEQLRSRTEKLECDSAQIRSVQEQLQSALDKTRRDNQQPSLAMEQAKSGVEQLHSEMERLRSNMEQLQSTVQSLLTGDTFVTKTKLKDLNNGFITTFGGWVNELKKRSSTLEEQVKILQNDIALQKSNAAASAAESRILPLETKWEEHDERIKTLEDTSKQYSQGAAKLSWEEHADALEKKHTSSMETTSAVIEALKTQIAMSEQSLKTISGSIKLMNDNQTAQTGRIAEAEAQMSKLSMQLMDLAQNIKAVEDKMEKRMDLLQHHYICLDSKMNNLTTETLFKAIIDYIDKYQPTELHLGQRMETIIQQVNQHEHRLVKVERSSSLSEEPASKKRKLSSNEFGPVVMANGSH